MHRSSLSTIFLRFVFTMCAMPVVSGAVGWQIPLRTPSSMLTHAVRLWTVDSLFQRANFLAEVAPLPFSPFPRPEPVVVGE